MTERTTLATSKQKAAARRRRRFAASLLALLVAGCAHTVTQSLDPDVNYALKFSQMPLPRATVVHSRVERVDPVRFFGFRLPPRNDEWEFELVASPEWVRVLQTDFVPIDWSGVKLRADVPEWFAPDPRRFSAFRIVGTSGLAAAHLFVETAPEHDDQMRLFVCRH